MQIRAVVVLIALVVLGFGPCAHAWNESGHRIIAASAAQQMSPEALAEVVRLLKLHPRYKEDFARYRPDSLSGLTEEEWLLGQAAQWPDRARRFNNASRFKRRALVKKYDHGVWHYINLPVYLSESDESLKIPDPIRSVADPAAGSPRNVLEALNFISSTLLDSKTSDQEKGLYLSWALHLIADVHQPLHTTAIFSVNRWPRGDRGGNEVIIAGSGKVGRPDSLHWLWDSALSDRLETYEVGRLAGALSSRRDLPVPSTGGGGQ